MLSANILALLRMAALRGILVISTLSCQGGGAGGTGTAPEGGLWRGTTDGGGVQDVDSNPVNCSASAACYAKGFCTRVNGVCAVGSDADCQQSNICHMSGQCSRNPATAECYAATDADCNRKDDTCWGNCCQIGKCTAQNGQCVVGSDSDCASAAVCKSDFKCKAEIVKKISPLYGQCVVAVSPDGCQSFCKLGGFCTWDPKSGDCLVKTDDECAQSDLCKQFGKCCASTIQGGKYGGLLECVEPGKCSKG